MAKRNDDRSGLAGATRNVDPIRGKQPDEFFTIGKPYSIADKIERQQKRDKDRD
jgi:hypothetical protein